MSLFTSTKEKLGNFSSLSKNSWRLIVIAFKKYPLLLIALVIVAAISSIIPFLQSGVIALIINSLVSATPDTDIFYFVVALVIISVFPDFLGNIYNFLDKTAWIQMMNTFELMFAKKQADLDIADLENPKFQDTIERVKENFYSMVNMLSSQFDLVRNIVGLTVASVILLTFSPIIFIVIFVSAIPGFWVEARYGSYGWGIWAAKSEERRRFSDLRFRFMHLPQLIELKIFQNATNFLRRMHMLLVNFEKEQIKNEWKRLAGNGISFVISIFSIGFAIFWAINQVSIGAIEVGTMTFVLYSITNFNNSFSAFLLTIANQFRHNLYVKDIFEVLDKKSTRSNREYSKINLEETPEIILKDISFSYPDSDEIILKDFSLTIRPNERLAIVGINGAGKTTLVKLLAGFYKPTKGKILINGVDLEDIDLVDWYSKLAILFQDYAVYNFLVKEGIALGDSGRPENIEQVKKAAEASDSDVFIRQWKKQYEQMIGKEFTEGVEPSKGQAQKLALARSFYRNPKILILDEPTASIDAEAEAKIFESLERMPKEQTIILISHRFSTVRNADRICVIEDGAVSELGSHEELLRNDKTYKRLFEKQARGYR